MLIVTVVGIQLARHGGCRPVWSVLAFLGGATMSIFAIPAALLRGGGVHTATSARNHRGDP
ncbi:hypothetical protein ACIRRA_12810 [Nocardia sp. NPDC101769]|uniref:hypothetical protein n=1 Tax=Nocardia sp. NPDC101769 TaxID=3364333 RepID=UPI00381EEA3D